MVIHCLEETYYISMHLCLGQHVLVSLSPFDKTHQQCCPQPYGLRNKATEFSNGGNNITGQHMVLLLLLAPVKQSKIQGS